MYIYILSLPELVLQENYPNICENAKISFTIYCKTLKLDGIDKKWLQGLLKLTKSHKITFAFKGTILWKRSASPECFCLKLIFFHTFYWWYCTTWNFTISCRSISRKYAKKSIQWNCWLFLLFSHTFFTLVLKQMAVFGGYSFNDVSSTGFKYWIPCLKCKALELFGNSLTH